MVFFLHPIVRCQNLVGVVLLDPEGVQPLLNDGAYPPDAEGIAQFSESVTGSQPRPIRKMRTAITSKLVDLS
jgi:hypothetical protein